MFSKSKDVEVRSRSLLNKKDVRSLKDSVSKQYPALKAEPYLSEFAAYLPDKAQVTEIKLANRTLLYLLGQKIIFFDYQGRQHLFPSVYTLWRFPKMMTQFVIHAPVSKFVLNGADLMLPGLVTIEGLEQLRVGERVCVRIRGNPMPFAVGESKVSYEGILVNNRKGRGMESFHFFGDLLCLDFDNGVNNSSMSISKVAMPISEVPNRGFVIGQEHIVPIESEILNGEAEDENSEEECDDGAGKSDEMTQNEIEKEAETDFEHEEQIIDSNEDVDQERGENNFSGFEVDSTSELVTFQDQESDLIGEHSDVGGGGLVSIAAQSSPLLSLSPDELVERATMLCLRYLIKPDKLPILASNLWFLIQRSSLARYETENTEESEDNGNIDIKKTSFKKVSNYFSTLEKRGLVTLQTTEDGVISIVTVDASHMALRGHKVRDPVAFKAFAYGTSVRPLSEASGAAGGESRGRSQLNEVEILSLTKLPKSLLFIPCDSIPHDRVFPGNKFLVADAKTCIDEYVTNSFVRAHGEVSSVAREKPEGGKLPTAVIVPADHEMYSFALKLMRQERSLAIKLAAGSETNNGGSNSQNSKSKSNGKTSNGKGKMSNKAKGDVIQSPISGQIVAYQAVEEDFEDGDELETEDADDSYDPRALSIQESAHGTFVGGVRVAPIYTPSTVKAPINPAHFPSLMTKKSAEQASAQAFVQNTALAPAWIKPNTSRSPCTPPNTKTSDFTEIDGGDCVIPKNVLLMGLYDLLPVSYAMIDGENNFKIIGNKFPKATVAYLKRAGKDVTVVKGLDVFGLDLKAVTNSLKKRFSCSVTIHESIPGAADGARDVALQGRWPDVLDYLVEQFKLPKKCIS